MNILVSVEVSQSSFSPFTISCSSPGLCVAQNFFKLSSANVPTFAAKKDVTAMSAYICLATVRL